MLTINTPQYGNVFAVADTFDELRELPANKIRPGYSALTNGGLARNDGLGGLYTWNELSTAGDDGETVICPTKHVAQGRWEKIAVGRIGDQGPQGIQGNTGLKGDKGNDGEGIATIMAPGGASLVGVTGGATVQDAIMAAPTANALASATKTIPAGAFVRTGDGHAFEALVSSATDFHIQTANGVKLRALPSSDGSYSADALGLCSGTDVSAQLTRLASIGISSISIPAGKTVKLNTVAVMSGTNRVSITGFGTLDCSGGGRLDIRGAHDALPTLSADTPAGARSVTFTAPHGLASGDVVAFWDTRESSAGTVRNYYHEGWRGVVATIVNSTTITVYGRINPALIASATRTYRSR